MVLEDEQDMATPGDSESPLAVEEGAPSPTPSTQTTGETKDGGMAEEETLPGMVPDETGEAPEGDAEAAPDAPEDAEDPMPASEEVMPEEAEAAPEMEAGDMADEPVEESIVKEMVGTAENMVDEVNAGAKNAIQSIGGKITDFIGGNMRKVRSLLHINKMPEGDDIADEAKALSSSTGDLAKAVKKSKACTIL